MHVIGGNSGWYPPASFDSLVGILKLEYEVSPWIWEKGARIETNNFDTARRDDDDLVEE